VLLPESRVGSRERVSRKTNIPRKKTWSSSSAKKRWRWKRMISKDKHKLEESGTTY